MNQNTINSTINLVGYDPRCSLYLREQTKGKSVWWIKYYLPYNIRVRRPCHTSQREAKKLLKIKEAQLFQGNFDDKDLKKLAKVAPVYEKPKRLTIDYALDLYLDTTSGNKTDHTQTTDSYSLKNWFSFFQDSEKQYMDEITPLDIQLFVKFLNKKGLAESSIRSGVTGVKKVFNWLIDDAEVLDYKNPVKKKLKIPKKGGVVRERIPTHEEFAAILEANENLKKHSSTTAPTKEIIKFIGSTGARLGEVLCAEWSDFDLEKGIWHIRQKRCPTAKSLQWAPKWFKNRSIPLFPEALKILDSLPYHPTIGRVQVRDANNKIIGHKEYEAQFIFPKREVRISRSCPMKKEKGFAKCFKCDRVADKNVCWYRSVIYSRLDNIDRSWETLQRLAKVSDLQVKDLRTFFNHILRTKYGFSSKEAGAYLGNSAKVNEIHYSPVTDMVVRQKMDSYSLEEAFQTSS